MEGMKNRNGYGDTRTLEEVRMQLESRLAGLASQDVCLAFSGGVDSSLLLKILADAASRTGKQVYAVTFNTRLHPPCDLEIAGRVAAELGGIHNVISVDELEQEAIRHNPVNRCYLCKHYLFQELKAFAAGKGIGNILDGTNENDLHEYRPGIQALKELGIRSPLAELHITKAEVKALAAAYGISVAARPSTPCMATRLPYHTEIDYAVLDRIAEGEEFLRTLISGNVRLRLHGEVARIEVDQDAFSVFLEKRQQVVESLQKLGFPYLTLDIEGFRSGSMDIHQKKDTFIRHSLL